MTVFELIAEQVTARDAAVAYGLKIGRSGRACCPWHDDRHPDLTFYGSHCYCHACHNGGDAVALTAQIFNLSMWDAAAKINTDFRLSMNMRASTTPTTPTMAQRQEQERQRENKEWDMLCTVEREADERLRALCDNSESLDTLWDDSRFTKVLEARSRASLALETMRTKEVK